MLNDAPVTATVAVKDIETGKQFYGETLGLKKVDENMGGVAYESGGSQLFVYQSDTAGTGQATCAFWPVNDIEGTVAELKGKGVNFEHYDMPGGTLEGDIHIMGEMKAAWFKDPDGNILSVGNNTQS
jgi:catechol 2,3-dioxygenase-like lactoylglutathione lyase family enzyme